MKRKGTPNLNGLDLKNRFSFITINVCQMFYYPKKSKIESVYHFDEITHKTPEKPFSTFRLFRNH